MEAEWGDFRLFLWHIFKHYLVDVLKDPTPVQYDIASYLANNPTPNKIIMAFRGIGKTYITALYCLWRLWKDPTLSILVISASKDHADKIATFMWRMMKEVPFLMGLDPENNEIKGARTSRMSFDVCGGGAKIHPSVKSVGITGMITGSRADIIIADDIEIPNNSDTVTKREKLRTATEEFDAILRTGDGKQIIFLGTPQSQESVYMDLPSSGDFGYKTRIWPAEYPKNDAMLRFYGDRLAPALRAKLANNEAAYGSPTDTRFDDYELSKKRAKYGRSGYALQFLLNTLLSDELRYPLRCRDFIIMDLDKEVHPERPVWASGNDTQIDTMCPGFEGDAFFSPMVTVGDWINYEGAVMAIDPSGRGHDETAYCVLKWGNGFMFVLDIGGLPGGHDEDALKGLALKAREWGVSRVLPERNWGGGMFGQLLTPVLRKYAPMASMVSEDEMPFHTTQKEKRIIETVEPVMNMHRVVVNKPIIESDRNAREGLGDEKSLDYQFFHQLTRINFDRGCLKHDDRLDAFAMAVDFAQKGMGLDPEQQAADREAAKYNEEMDAYIRGDRVLGMTVGWSNEDTGGSGHGWI